MRQRETECECVHAHTSKCSQQDLLVEGHGALVCAAHHVPHRLVDGKSSEGIGHLRGEEQTGETDVNLPDYTSERKIKRNLYSKLECKNG